MKVNKFVLKLLAILPVLLLAVIVTTGSSAHASISGDATIHNWVSVTYTSGAISDTVTASVNVIVATVATAPTVTVAGQTVLAGAAVSYSTDIKSNANGKDTYVIANPSNTPGGGYSSVPTITLATGNVTLWGGITVVPTSGTTNHLYFPGGSLANTGLVAGTSIISYNGNMYTVSAINPGSGHADTAVNAPSTEVPDDLALTKIGNSPDISSWSAGVQVGEKKTFTFITFTAPNPTLGTDGTITHGITATTTATTLAGASQAASTSFVTTVLSPKLTISKKFRVLSAGAPVTSDISSVTYYSANSGIYPAESRQPRPGEIVEYLITVTNSNTNASAIASGVTIKDPLPVYTDYMANSTYAKINSTTLTQVPDSGGTSVLFGATGYALGDIPGNQSAYIVFQVKVQ